MQELRDNNCPFCRSVGTVEFFESATSLYSTLYKCGLCASIYDSNEKDIEERRQRKEQLAKIEAMKVEDLLPTAKLVKKRGSLLFKVGVLTVVILFITFST